MTKKAKPGSKDSSQDQGRNNHLSEDGDRGREMPASGNIVDSNPGLSDEVHCGDRLKALLDHTYQFIGLLSPDGVLLEANRPALSFIAMSNDEVLGRPFWETPWWTHSPEMQEKLKQAVKTAATGTFVRFRASHVDPQGRLRQIDFSLSPYRNPAGEITYLIPEGRDVTDLKLAEAELEAHKQRLESLIAERNKDLAELRREVAERKAAEDALKASEQRFMDIFYSSPDAVFLITNEKFADCNDAAIRLFGVQSKAEMLNYHPADISPPFQPDGESSYQKAEREMTEAFDKGVNRFQWTHRRVNGEEFPAEVWAISILLGGKPILYGVVRDLTTQKAAEEELRAHREHLEELVQARTEELNARNVELNREVAERRLAEEALRKSERRYRVLFNSITDFIYTHTLDGIMLSINPKAARSIGYEPESVAGRPLTDFMPQSLHQTVMEEFIPDIIRNGHREGFLTLVDSEGNERFLEYRSVLVDNDGPDPYISGSGREVTDRIIAEKERRLVHEQQVRSQKMQAVGTLASGVAHDFNNVLQGISGYVELLGKSSNLSEIERGYLSEVALSARRAARLVKHLLTFSSKAPVDLMPLDINKEVVHVIGLLERTIPKMVEIEFNPGQGLDPVHGDPSQLEQLMLNLGINARDAMPDGGRLLFETSRVSLDEQFAKMHPGSRPGEYVLLKVTDTGHGMTHETQQHMFEPFFTTKPQGKGTGLGLATVFGIVKAHQGYISGYSELERGTSFSIYLPTTDSFVQSKYYQPVDDYKELKGSETILLVDDEGPIREMGKSFLSDFGYRVITAASGEEALDIYSRDPRAVDLVILDLGMPGMGGAKCLSQLLTLDPLARVIIASGYSPNASAFNDAAAGFIPKPYHLRDLAEKVRMVLDR